MGKSIICLIITICIALLFIIPLVMSIIYASDKFYNYKKGMLCTRISFCFGMLSGIWTIIQIIILC